MVLCEVLQGVDRWQRQVNREEMTEDLAPLRNAITRELYAQYTLRCDKIAFVDLPEIAYAVAASLQHEFRIQRLPDVYLDLADPEIV
jgi:hypothetical protein